MNQNFRISNDIRPTTMTTKNLFKLPLINTQLHPIPPFTIGIYYDTNTQKIVYAKDGAWKTLLLN